MKGTQGYFLLAGLGLIALVNAIVLLGAAWNRQEPAESRLQLSERELVSRYGYARKENSGIGLRLDYRWPSAEGDEGFYPSISLEKMLELGFQQPAGLDDDSLRRYSRQQQREALLVLELDGPAYQREVRLARDRYAEAQRLQQLDPGNQTLADEARQAASSLDSQQHRISRLLVVDLGLDRQALRARYPDRQRYAIVRGHVRPSSHRQRLPWHGEGADTRPDEQRWQWQLGGSGESAGLGRIHLQQRWHKLFASLPRGGVQDDLHGKNYDKQFNVELAFGRRLEPWIVDLQERRP
jgi:hypothetical protein